MTARLGQRFVLGAMRQERSQLNVYRKTILKPFKRQPRPIFGMRRQGCDHQRLQHYIGRQCIFFAKGSYRIWQIECSCFERFLKQWQQPDIAEFFVHLFPPIVMATFRIPGGSSRPKVVFIYRPFLAVFHLLPRAKIDPQKTVNTHGRVSWVRRKNC